ncbi:MAG: hypothetical protein JSW27_21555 [Phycisphaerales bacterium]|nr:MAG: hypothetical protein JSW27_21555 [Phycisphaerales bacterium]
MAFNKAFRQKINAVRLRCSVNALLSQTGQVAVLTGGVAVLVVLIERLLAVTVRTPATLWGGGAVAAILIVIPWLFRVPGRMQASLLLDERLKLSERFSTTLALAESDDPFARAARAESLRVVQQASLRGHFPIDLSRPWYYGAGIWGVVIALFFFLPQKDLLGFLKEREKKEQQAQAFEQAQDQVKQTAEIVKASVKDLGEPNLAEDLSKLDELAQAGAPEEVKRQAIKALGDLSEKIKKMQSGTQVKAADVLQQMFKRLHGSADPFAQQVRMAMAKGDFAQAVNLLSQLQKQLAEQTIPEARRQELAQQLQQLAKELQKLAEQKRELEEELEKRGLSKDLAQMTPEQLKRALQRQGLKPEMIEQLMQKMAACQAAQGRCSGLGQALAAAGAGGLVADDLSDVIDQLNAVELLQQQAVMLQASLNEISRCMGRLGQNLCEGLQRGDGAGTMPTEAYSLSEEIQGSTKTTRATGKTDAGPIIASWYFKDTQVRGEARRGFSEVVQAGRASAAEAISENQIPRRYEDAVKEYFSQLEENSPQP